MSMRLHSFIVSTYNSTFFLFIALPPNFSCWQVTSLKSPKSNQGWLRLCAIACLNLWYEGVAFESCDQWYFYTRKTDNRISENGYWKELMDMEHPILGSKSNKLAGFKKCLVFYKGKYPSSGVKTRWFMQEYHAYISTIVGDTRRSKQQVSMNIHWLLHDTCSISN